MTSILYSGGADGSDFVFGECAKYVKHNVTHFSFYGHNTRCEENIVVLNDIQLHMADDYLQEANMYLKRRWPTQWDNVNKLLERNYYQIKDSKRIYAVSSFERNGHIKGGTAWAVMMGILKGINEIYVFDQGDSNWYSFQDFDKEKNVISWKIIPYPPFPINNYTGIGNRLLRMNGEKAIYGLYNIEVPDISVKDN